MTFSPIHLSHVHLVWYSWRGHGVSQCRSFYKKMRPCENHHVQKKNTWLHSIVGLYGSTQDCRFSCFEYCSNKTLSCHVPCIRDNTEHLTHSPVLPWVVNNLSRWHWGLSNSSCVCSPFMDEKARNTCYRSHSAIRRRNRQFNSSAEPAGDYTAFARALAWQTHVSINI